MLTNKVMATITIPIENRIVSLCLADETLSMRVEISLVSFFFLADALFFPILSKKSLKLQR